jgi:catechol 2,3-dioxygenase-like lactoylglutathione lyase family enzyme
MIQHVSAITFAVRDMRQAVAFYCKLGCILTFGGPDARFSTLQAGETFVNLTLSPGYQPQWWGRVIFRVENADAMHRLATAQGLTPELPRHGAWGERYFHLTDPDGHELSFAQLIAPQS